MSVRLSTKSPRACSGLMYDAVPTTSLFGSAMVLAPSALRQGGWDHLTADFASPKSRTFVVPSWATLMLDGFRSRWTIPRWWAASRRSPICLAIRTAS